MPIYEFVCPICGNKEERFLGMAVRNKKCFCIKCGAELKRVYSTFNTKHLIIHSDKPPKKQKRIIID